MVGYHRETHHFREEKSTKEFTAPQHTRFILPPIHPTKSIAALRGRYFFLRLNNSETFVELVGARPLHLLSQTVLPLKSPTGAFIAPLRFANAVYAF